MIKVLISLVAYNEEETIGDVIVEIKKTMEKMSKNQIYYEILVVDDGSTDKTGEIAKRHGVNVVKHFINLGPGQALKTSYMYAIRNNFDVIVRLDADGQHLPEYIPCLLEPILKNEADIIIGSRYLSGNSYKSSFIRDFGNILHSKLLTLLTGQKLTDITSGFRAIKIDVLKDIVKYDFPDIPAVYITLKKALIGYRIKEVAVKMHPRIHGESYLNLKRLIIYPFKAFFTVIKTFMEEI